MTTEGIDLGDLGRRRDELAAEGVRPFSWRSTDGPSGFLRWRTRSATPQLLQYASCMG